MKVSITSEQNMSVSALEVVDELLKKALYWRHWIIEKDGKYFRGEPCPYIKSNEAFIPISKEEYDYIKSLQTLQDYYKKNGTVNV
jgi:hypothetical protein